VLQIGIAIILFCSFRQAHTKYSVAQKVSRCLIIKKSY